MAKKKIAYVHDWDLEIQNFPDCCGIDVITYFPQGNEDLMDLDNYDWDWDAEPDGPEDVELKKGVIEEVLSSTVKRGIAGDTWQKGGGCLLISLTTEQIKRYGKAVLAEGFKKKLSFVNPKTSNTVTLFAKIVNQPEKQPKKVKRAF